VQLVGVAGVVRDVDPVRAKVMYAVQQPLHVSALSEAMVSHPDEALERITAAANSLAAAA
jgi:hypothetical protein